MTVKDVCRLNKGEKVIVETNKYGQPVKAARGLCTRFMTLLPRQPSLCPIEAKNWPEVKTSCGLNLMTEFQEKFSLLHSEMVDKVIFAHFDYKFRSIKYRRKKINEVNNVSGDGNNAQPRTYTEDELLQALDYLEPLDGVADHQWELYKSHLRNPKTKEKAKKEIAKKIQELGVSGPVDVSKMHEIERDVIRDVMTKLMGPDMLGRARGYGTGVGQSQVTPRSHDLRQMRADGITNSNQNHMLLAQISTQEKQINMMQQTINELKKQLQVFQVAFESIFNTSSAKQLFTRSGGSNTQVASGDDDDSNATPSSDV